MKLKQLESMLGDVTQFTSPKIDLEQYPTGPHIASRMLYMAESSFGDISNKVVADFGCGCGTLGLAAVLLDAGHVIGVDIDSDALEIAKANILELEVEMDLVQANLQGQPWRGNGYFTDSGCFYTSLAIPFAESEPRLASSTFFAVHKADERFRFASPILCTIQSAHGSYNSDQRSTAQVTGSIDREVMLSVGSPIGPVVDTVVMNPPFGTRRKGADMEFLSAALKVADKAVYSLHKTTTREHVKRGALRDFGAKSAQVLCELRYDLPASYKFHKKREVDIAVDLWRFTTS